MTTLTDYKLINVGYFRHADQDADGQCSIGINYYRCCSMHTGDSYVAVTAHWLDPQWNMMSCVLGVSMSNGKIFKIAIYNIVLYTQ